MTESRLSLENSALGVGSIPGRPAEIGMRKLEEVGAAEKIRRAAELDLNETKARLEGLEGVNPSLVKLGCAVLDGLGGLIDRVAQTKQRIGRKQEEAGERHKEALLKLAQARQGREQEVMRWRLAALELESHPDLPGADILRGEAERVLKGKNLERLTEKVRETLHSFLQGISFKWAEKNLAKAEMYTNFAAKLKDMAALGRRMVEDRLRSRREALTGSAEEAMRREEDAAQRREIAKEIIQRLLTEGATTTAAAVYAARMAQTPEELDKVLNTHGETLLKMVTGSGPEGPTGDSQQEQPATT